MTLSAFPWFGGKTNMAQWITGHLPDHLTYVEPFGGSAAVLLNKQRSHTEVYNDKDGDVVHFFRVARERPDELGEWVSRVPYAESQFHEWWNDFYGDGARPEDDIKRAGQWVFLRYTNFSGHVATKRGFRRDSKNDPKGGRESRNWSNVPERIHRICERLRGVTILDEDYRDCIKRYDTPDTVFYLDPPYVDNEDVYNETAVHGDISAALDGIEGYAMVSYMEIPSEFNVDEWTILEKDVVHRGSGTGEQATEVLLCNFDPDAVTPFVHAEQATLVSSDGGETPAHSSTATDRKRGDEA